MHEILINRSHSIHHAHFQRIMRKFASILTNLVRGAVTHQDLARVEVPEGKRDGLVGLGRFELPTHGLGNRCSIHLSYRPIRERHECSRIASHRTILIPGTLSRCAYIGQQGRAYLNGSRANGEVPHSSGH